MPQKMKSSFSQLKFALVVTFGLSLSAATHAFAVDLSRFQDMNFEPVSSEYCGLHIEISDNILTFTNIIPPSAWLQPGNCGDGGRWAGCVGLSEALECDSRGMCRDLEDGRLAFVLLNDGNFISMLSGTKYMARSPGTFWYCPR
ncbi:MAG: hypothetical protein NDJ89_03625 [Oligoflexia bacterium]|nr:hypothetical protein [Oligoflexia bacterium]